MTTTHYGNKYEATKGLSTTEIAKEVRKDIKALVTLGVIPKGIKTSVRTAYFSGGSSLDVEVTALPEEIPVWNPEYLIAESRDEHFCRGIRHESDALKGILNALEKVVADYNYDGSDSQSDYFHVRFYGHVTVDSDLRRDRKAGELDAALTREKDEIVRSTAAKALGKALYDLVRHCDALAYFAPDLSGLTHKTVAPAGGHTRTDIHGYPETLTTAVFEANGLTHVARRFWRSDVPTTGKIELYTIEPGTGTEDFFRYVDEFQPGKVDVKAIRAIEAASAGTYIAPASLDFYARAELLELR